MKIAPNRRWSREQEDKSLMWHWDQGRMSYFQYDALRKIACFVAKHTWTRSDPNRIRDETGLSFAAPSTHSPWRNYSRIFKLCLLISENDGRVIPTPVAQLLSQAGAVTCDEYLHFLVEATTDPSPALKGWDIISACKTVRYPLCFSLKYLMAKVIDLNEPITSIHEVIGAYIHSEFVGTENVTAFLDLMHNCSAYVPIGRSANPRQARESIKFISQISYLHSDGGNIITSLSQKDALNMFQGIRPISGPHEADGGLEIQRLAALFDGGERNLFNYKTPSGSDELYDGFSEGSKAKKMHIVIERNSKLRAFFFDRMSTTVCDACHIDTKKKYPWTDRILDLHHILPLSSGTRVDSKTGTKLEDLTPVCPTCHRAIHRFYDCHLKAVKRQDFLNEKEAHDVYTRAKGEIIKGYSNA